jgi:hypothetical protein
MRFSLAELVPAFNMFALKRTETKAAKDLRMEKLPRIANNHANYCFIEAYSSIGYWAYSSMGIRTMLSFKLLRHIQARPIVLCQQLFLNCL